MLLQLQEWNQAESVIRGYLNSLQYSQPTVVMRHFSGYRTTRVLRTGTDRTRGSTIWGHDYDSREPKPADLSSIIYAWTVDVQKTPFELVRFYGPRDFRPVMNITEGLALYNSEALIRKSECEYQFLIHPKDALLGVIITPQTAPADSRLQEIARIAQRHIRRYLTDLEYQWAEHKVKKMTIFVDTHDSDLPKFD